MSGTTGRRGDVLAALRDATPRTIAEIAAELDVHPNTVRFHLDALVEAARAEVVTGEPSGPGRPAQRYRAVSGMDPGGPRSYRVLAEVLVDTLADGSAATAAGRAWGSRLPGPTRTARPAPYRTRLQQVLDDLGFAPEEQGPDRIALRHCPFLELAGAHPEVVCSVHLGLMQGALEAWSAPVTVDRLVPFAEPDRCLAHLTPA